MEAGIVPLGSYSAATKWLGKAEVDMGRTFVGSPGRCRSMKLLFKGWQVFPDARPAVWEGAMKLVPFPSEFFTFQ